MNGFKLCMNRALVYDAFEFGDCLVMIGWLDFTIGRLFLFPNRSLLLKGSHVASKSSHKTHTKREAARVDSRPGIAVATPKNTTVAMEPQLY